jgi:hypothetical protein
LPPQKELAQLQLGQVIERIPPRPNQRPLLGTGSNRGSDVLDPFEGTWEVLTTDEEGRPVLDRHDVWGWVPAVGAKPADNLKGFNFVQQELL